MLVGPVITGVNVEFTVTLADAVPEQLDAFVTVTVYVPVVVTPMVSVVAAVLHK